MQEKVVVDMDFALPSPSSKIQKLVKGEDKGEDKDIISKLPDSVLHEWFLIVI